MRRTGRHRNGHGSRRAIQILPIISNNSGYAITLKAEYPPFRPREITAIRRRRDDCRIHHSTVQRILATSPLPAGIIRRYPSYAQMRDGLERRRAIVALYFDGWNIASIAGYLETNRPRVYETLYRFFSEDFAGLADKSRAPKRPARKVDFEAMAAKEVSCESGWSYWR
jgi:hypothetical protein